MTSPKSSARTTAPAANETLLVILGKSVDLSRIDFLLLVWGNPTFFYIYLVTPLQDGSRALQAG
jgi:hypothetical protein